MGDGYYITYLRKSRADVEKERLGKFETLAIHAERLERYARDNGLRVEHVYRELVSGESIQARTEFQAVMERISDPDCIGVIVHAIDRLGRGDPMEYGWILSTFRYTRTLIVTPTRTYDPTVAEDIQSLKLQMFVSNIELEHIRERMNEGSRRAVERGGYHGPFAPYGYDRGKIGMQASIVPNETEAPIVRRMFSMACDGMNKGAIARRLNEDGIPTRHGKLWTASAVGRTLSNDVYKGVVTYGKYSVSITSRDGLTFEKKRVYRKRGEYVEAHGIHEPLVDAETWATANRRAFEGVPVQRDRSVKNPLAGLIVCGKCGYALVRQVVTPQCGRPYARLHHKYGTECHCVSIRLDYVVEKVAEALEQITEDLDMGLVRPGAAPGELESVEAQLARESGKLDKLLELFYADALTVEEFSDRRDESRRRVDRLRARRDELEKMETNAEAISMRTREAVALLRDDSISAEAKNDALKAVIERIEYYELDTARENRAIHLDIRLRGFK